MTDNKNLLCQPETDFLVKLVNLNYESNSNDGYQGTRASVIDRITIDHADSVLVHSIESLTNRNIINTALLSSTENGMKYQKLD